MKLFHPKATPEQRQKAVAQLIADLNADRRPILLGPFRSELGFEVSYWLPFLTWLKSKVVKFDTRSAVVSRGGVAPLYRAVAAQGLDLYALRDVKDVRRENLHDQQQAKVQKQVTPTAWDDAVLHDAAKALGLGDCHVVHPAWMYWALEPYWNESRGMDYLRSMTDYTPLEKPVLADLHAPAKFVAVKFYARMPTFPHPDPEVMKFVQNVVGIIAAQCPVLILDGGWEFDDHQTIPVTGPNIQCTPRVLPEQNLLVQAACLAKATAFVGTYGGVAQLALRMGVPSVSFWKDWGGTAHAHLSLSSWLSKATKVPFLTGSMVDAELWRQVVTAPGMVESKVKALEAVA